MIVLLIPIVCGFQFRFPSFDRKYKIFEPKFKSIQGDTTIANTTNTTVNTSSQINTTQSIITKVSENSPTATTQWSELNESKSDKMGIYIRVYVALMMVKIFLTVFEINPRYILLTKFFIYSGLSLFFSRKNWNE